MRKKYMTPEMVAIQISSNATLLAGSIGINSTDTPIDASDAAAPELDFPDLNPLMPPEL